MEDIFGSVIYQYTREQAIEDGVLFDVTELAREAGFKVPVAITVAVKEIVENIPESMKSSQDVTGRLWDILSILMLRARGSNGNLINFDVFMPHGRRKKCELKALIHGGDNGEPVITIMLPNED